MSHLLPEDCHQPRQFQEIRQAEGRPTGREDHHRVGRNHVRPTGGNAGQLTVLVMVVDPIVAPVMPNRHKRELLAMEGMKWMGDAERLCRIVPIACI
jgi:hypothetical protein